MKTMLTICLMNPEEQSLKRAASLMNGSYNLYEICNRREKIRMKNWTASSTPVTDNHPMILYTSSNEFELDIMTVTQVRTNPKLTSAHIESTPTQNYMENWNENMQITTLVRIEAGIS